MRRARWRHRARARWRHRAPARRAVFVLSVSTVALLVTATGPRPPALAGTKAAAAAAAGGPAWTVYHGGPEGNGVGGAMSVDLSTPAWRSPVLDGQLYGEPLVAGGRVYVATEADTVEALSANTGTVVWSTRVGTPVPSSSLPCGNIAPTVGITGTPVLDEGRGELFVVADELVAGAAAHELIGIDTATGKIELTQDVDPAGATPAALLQRTGLNLDNGRVVFGFGGNYGDCGAYHGWVVSVPETGGTPAEFEVDAAPGDHQGAVWMGGAAPVVDPAGDVWVTTGNGSVTSPGHAYDNSVAVLDLSPALTLRQYFAPATWTRDNAHDLDLSTSPALLADGQVVAAGKGGTAYLLAGAALGGIGGQQASLPAACGGDIDGGTAVQGTVVYLPCLRGPVAVQATASPPRLRLLWRASAGGGPPVLAAGLVWTMGQDGVLSGLDPTTGAVQQRTSIGPPANHFPTPSVGDGLLVASSAKQVVAFAAPPGPAAPTTSTTTSTAASSVSTSTVARHATTTPATSGGAGPWLIVVAALGAATLLGGAAWGLRRRRHRHAPPHGAE